MSSSAKIAQQRRIDVYPDTLAKLLALGSRKAKVGGVATRCSGGDERHRHVELLEGLQALCNQHLVRGTARRQFNIDNSNRQGQRTRGGQSSCLRRAGECQRATACQARCGSARSLQRSHSAGEPSRPGQRHRAQSGPKGVPCCTTSLSGRDEIWHNMRTQVQRRPSPP